MRIRIKDRAKLQPGKMVKIVLAATPHALLDLYCVAPGQEQKPHTHSDQDKFYVVVEGRGRFRLGDAEHALEAEDALIAPAGVEHGLVNDSDAHLLIVVLVTPPPPHA